MQAYTLKRSELELLADLDRLIDWHRDNNKPLNKLIVSKKQAQQLRTLFRKIQDCDVVYSDTKGKIDLSATIDASIEIKTYRSIPIETLTESKRPRKTDTRSMPL